MSSGCAGRAFFGMGVTLTVDITPEAVEHLCAIHEGYEQHGTAITLRALSAALTASQAETPVTWQPFETAPYDTPILVWYVNRIISCIVPKASNGAYVWVQVLDGFRDGFQLGVKPSHWMPCPPNPDAEITAIPRGKDHE